MTRPTESHFSRNVHKVRVSRLSFRRHIVFSVSQVTTGSFIGSWVVIRTFPAARKLLLVTRCLLFSGLKMLIFVDVTGGKLLRTESLPVLSAIGWLATGLSLKPMASPGPICIFLSSSARATM